MKNLSGIVLAAGEGRRMGTTKALLQLQGATLVEHHVTRLVEVGCTSIAVVVRPTIADAIRTLLRRQSQAQIAAVNSSSQAESLAGGLRALDAAGSSRADVIVITPVDLLPPEAATYRALLVSLDGGTLAVTPQCGARGGHPVVARRGLLAAYEPTSPGPPPSLRDVLAQAGASRRRLPVDDRRVLGDFDTPADWLAVSAGA